MECRYFKSTWFFQNCKFSCVSKLSDVGVFFCFLGVFFVVCFFIFDNWRWSRVACGVPRKYFFGPGLERIIPRIHIFVT